MSSFMRYIGLQVLEAELVSGWERGGLEAVTVTHACLDSGSGLMRMVAHTASSPASLHSSPVNRTSKSACFSSCTVCIFHTTVTPVYSVCV